MAASSKLTAELVARLPRPGMVAPDVISYSPDGLHITYLYSERGDLTRELWRLDVRTGKRESWLAPPGDGVDERNVSREEALRRERQRIQTAGITHYRWAENANILLLPIQDVVYRWQEGELTKLVDQATDPQISRDGRTVFFVRDGDLWAAGDAGARRLTADAEPG
ncbi:MAG: hypothetical protein WB682_08725, partial [Candidatus Dormiibacterota bacterium]